MAAPLELLVNSINSVGYAFLQPIIVQILTIGLQALPLTLTFWRNTDVSRDQNTLNVEVNDNYDFIIVGAGCAGGVLANRLSRDYKVLLLEAGGEINPVQLIPLFATFLFNYPEVDYSYRSVTQRYFDALQNKQVSLSAGKGLGGSTSINNLVFLRGHVNDFNNWAKITGDPSWSWDGVLPFFKRFENYEIPGDNVNHGYDGELRIETPDYIGLAREFIVSANELGYPNVDLNAPFSEGFDVIRYPIRHGQRQAVYKAFIEPVRTRQTLTIRKFAQVNKVLMKHDNIAYGVEYDRHGKTYVAYASKEVILSAGTIGTAKLLMLSGIGPQSHLESLNIPVRANIPVGMNLKDHPVVLLGPFFINQPRSLNTNRDVTLNEFLKWVFVGRGRLTTSTAEATGLISSKFAKARGDGNWPDIQYLLQCTAITNQSIPAFSHSFNIKLDELSEYLGPAIDRDGCLIGVIGSRPLSVGYMKLGGNSPYDTPILQPNYLSDDDEIDVKVLVDGIKTVIKIMEDTTVFGGRLGGRLTETVLPGCENVPFRSDAYWECYVKRLCVSIGHYSGTASMASVVDTQLRVFGINNLRVVDHSVSPEQVSTNTMASTIMIAEKGADMILQYWNRGQTELLY